MILILYTGVLPRPRTADIGYAGETSNKAALNQATHMESTGSTGRQIADAANVKWHIPSGTRITITNWQQYRQFMPDGMMAFFEGRHFWKMPSDVSMEIGPTTIHPLPRSYREATDKLASSVRLIELRNGGLDLEGYHGGLPFPSPSEPHKGWKILANVWFRYLPYVAVDTYGSSCTLDSYKNVACSAGEVVYRQLSYNTDPDVPMSVSSVADKFFTLYIELTEPEQQRYTASLTESYIDLMRPEDIYVFIPALRRSQVISSRARCSPSLGTDMTPDDRHDGFDSNITQLKVDYLGEGTILALIGLNVPHGRFPAQYDMPLGWPGPSFGKWQLRDVYKISVKPIQSATIGQCYGKRVMYVDKQLYTPLWEDLYDDRMKPWKMMALFLATIDEASIGPIDNSLSGIQAVWDIKNNHATFLCDPADGRPFYINREVPQNFLDLHRYSEPSGLDMIMR